MNAINLTKFLTTDTVRKRYQDRPSLGDIIN